MISLSAFTVYNVLVSFLRCILMVLMARTRVGAMLYVQYNRLPYSACSNIKMRRSGISKFCLMYSVIILTSVRCANVHSNCVFNVNPLAVRNQLMCLVWKCFFLEFVYARCQRHDIENHVLRLLGFFGTQ
jgi:hypothetical protein